MAPSMWTDALPGRFMALKNDPGSPESVTSCLAYVNGHSAVKLAHMDEGSRLRRSDGRAVPAAPLTQGRAGTGLPVEVVQQPLCRGRLRLLEARADHRVCADDRPAAWPNPLRRGAHRPIESRHGGCDGIRRARRRSSCSNTSSRCPEGPPARRRIQLRRLDCDSYSPVLGSSSTSSSSSSPASTTEYSKSLRPVRTQAGAGPSSRMTSTQYSALKS